jgi:hypothetical protein
MAFISNGTTILDNGAFSVGLGSKILLSTATASASASIEFTSGIDSTYDVYQFEFINMHPASDGVNLGFQLSTNSGSSYGITKTSSHFRVVHDEADTSTSLQYDGALHLAQSTSTQLLTENSGNGNDESSIGEMYLFSPSSTTFVKHYIIKFNTYQLNNYTISHYIGGYANTTSAIDAIKFLFSTGNIDAGTIKMYGIKGS